MKIAVTYENGLVFQHFGRTEQFKIYDTADMNGACVVSTNGTGHSALAGFLQERGVQALICGGIGGGAMAALHAAGIKVYGGVSGSADEAAAQLASGTLVYDPDIQCSHHSHDHGAHGGGCAHEGGCSHRCSHTD